MSEQDPLLKAAMADLKKHLLSPTQLQKGRGPQKILSSGLKPLDATLGDGIPLGNLCEWGLPPGKQGRWLILQFLAKHKPLTLWAYPDSLLEVYPPAWQAQGVDLSSVYFVKSAAPVHDLRPVFLEPLFEVIVLDSPLHCSKEEQAFLAKQARTFSQSIFLLRPYFLCNAKGNPLAKFRLNSWFDPKNKNYTVETLRGFPPARVRFSANSLTPGEAPCMTTNLL